MNTKQFSESIDLLCKRLHHLTDTKGEEYKRRDQDQFANFNRLARDLKLTREQVLFVYLSKHIDSITTFVVDNASKINCPDRPAYSEPIGGRIDDAILYLLLLRGMTTEAEANGSNSPTQQPT